MTSYGRRPDAMVTLACYGDRFASYPFRIGKAVLLRHIWSCPKGAMPWARRVRWHLIDGPDRLTGRHIGPVWSTSHRGWALSHYLWLELPQGGKSQ